MTKPNWKAPVSLTLAVVVCGLPACDSYALLGLDPDGTATNTNANSSPVGGGGGGGGQTNSNTNGSVNGNANSVAELTGEVDRVLCDNFLVLNEDGASVPFVYQTTRGGDVGEWADRDAVVFDQAAGQLANLNLNVDVDAARVGEYESTSQLVIVNAGILTVQLQDGSVWIYPVNETTEVDQWRTRQDNIAVVTLPSGGSALINLRRCALISATPL